MSNCVRADTSHWRDVFDDEVLTHCEEIMRKGCEDFDAGQKEFNGNRDHVTRWFATHRRSPSP